MLRRWPGFLVLLWAALLVGGLGLAVPARAQAIITLLEGDAIVVDGARTLAAAAGLRLSPATIVDTSPRTQLLRIEWADGATLDLGPDSRVMISPPGFAAREGKTPSIYLLQGWAKLAAGSAPLGGLAAPGIDVMPFAGAVVAFVSGKTVQLFMESGKTQVIERNVKGAPKAALGNGEHYTGGSADKGDVAPRPPAAFLKSTPRSFRDTMPKRYAALKDKKVEAVGLGESNYLALQDWLTAEPAIRKDFPRRFVSLAQDPNFRQALTAKLALHPEWSAVVQPPRRNDDAPKQ